MLLGINKSDSWYFNLPSSAWNILFTLMPFGGLFSNGKLLTGSIADTWVSFTDYSKSNSYVSNCNLYSTVSSIPTFLCFDTIPFIRKGQYLCHCLILAYHLCFSHRKRIISLKYCVFSLYLLKKGLCMPQFHHLLNHNDLNWGQVSDNYWVIRKLVITTDFRAVYSGIIQKQSHSDHRWVCWGAENKL